MTRKIRWLSALVLLLAVGAVAVRAEEEDAPPPHRPMTAELLPAPLPVPVDAPYVRVMPPAMPFGMWSFIAPAPLPCPASFVPAGFASYGEGCGACSRPAPCPCSGCPFCAGSETADAAEYVIEMKLVKAGADGDDQVRMCPRVSVLENQTATVEMDGVESPKEQCSHRIQTTVMKSAKGVLLALHVVETCAHSDGEFGLRAHSESTEVRVPVLLGKATKTELTHDSNGACTSWVEVKVTEVETEAAPKTAEAANLPLKVYEEEEDQEEFGLNDFVEILQGCFETGAEAAAIVVGAHTCPDANPQMSQCPLQYCPEYCPPLSGRSCNAPATCTTPVCTQCVAVEAAKKPTCHVSIDASYDRPCVEIKDGGMHVKATADHLVMHDDCIQLDGDVHCVSSDDRGCETVIKVDHLMLDCKDGVAKVRLDD